MNDRRIENLKVFFREKPILYEIAKILYLPVRVIEKLNLKIEIHKKVSKSLRQLEQLDRNKKYVFYLGLPICKNLGDAAMMMCIRRWIRDNFADFDVIEMESYPTYNKRIRAKLQNFVNADDIFVTQSGATFCNRHIDHGMHRYILESFPNNRILFMPVTIDLTDPGELEITAELFNTHKHSLLLTRDHVSYDMISKEFDSARVRVYPDIVTTMIGHKKYDNIKRDGILVCKRIDGEIIYTDKGLESFFKKMRKLSHRVDMTDMYSEQTHEYMISCAEGIIDEKLNQFASYKVIVTDRFHGMIYALVANTPAVILPTKGHKVREGARWFGKYYPNSIFFCETLEQAEEKIGELIRNDGVVLNESIFKEQYYDKLKDEFNSVTLF